MKMDIVNRISLIITDEISGATTTGNVDTNLAKGNVDIVGGKCPKGQVYDTKKQVCVPVSKVSEEEESGYDYNQKLVTMIRFVENNIMSLDEAAEKIATMFNYSVDKIKADFNKVMKGKEAKNETSVVGGSYISGTTTNIIGSGQTRIWGVKRDLMPDLSRKEKVESDMDDATEKNIIGRPSLQFDKGSGAYVPSHWLMSHIGDE